MKLTLTIEDDKKATIIYNFIKTIEYIDIENTDINEDPQIHIPKQLQNEINKRLSLLLETPDDNFDLDKTISELENELNI